MRIICDSTPLWPRCALLTRYRVPSRDTVCLHAAQVCRQSCLRILRVSAAATLAVTTRT